MVRLSQSQPCILQTCKHIASKACISSISGQGLQKLLGPEAYIAWLLLNVARFRNTARSGMPSEAFHEMSSIREVAKAIMA